MKRLLIRGGMLGWLLVCTLSTAWGRPELEAPLQRIDFATKSVTFGGQTYRLADEVRWVGLRGRRPQDVVPLMVGHDMGLIVTYTLGTPVVTEIWIRK